MKCSNCGTINDNNAKFCLKCGNPLVNNGGELNNQVNNQPINNNVNVSQNVNPNQVGVEVSNPNNGTLQPNNNPVHQNNSMTIAEYIMYGINMLIKPYKTYKEKESKTSSTKFSLIFSAIIVFIMMFINIVKTMVSVIFVKSFDYHSLSYTSSISFENLKNINYFALIGKSLLAYILLVAGIAFIYYIACLILKKSNNFFKDLTLAASSLIPYIVIGMIIAPIMGMIWSPLSSIISNGGLIYSGLIFVNIINEDISFSNNDQKIYFHLLCLFLIVVIRYLMNRFLLTGFITTNVNDVLNYLK